VERAFSAAIFPRDSLFLDSRRGLRWHNWPDHDWPKAKLSIFEPMKLPSIRKFFHGFSRLIDNRRALKQMFYMATHDELDMPSVRAARRLVARGHAKSAHCRLPVGANGEPLAWYTYPLLDFLAGIETRPWIIVEFGSGQSTRYWSARASKVISFESDPRWIDELKKDLPRNVRLELAATAQDVVNALRGLNEEPDLVVLDGAQRKFCAEQCLSKFGTRPIYLLDNSDWFLQTSKAFKNAGLTELRFCGFGPINDYAWCSSLWVAESSLAFLRATKESGVVPCGLPAGRTEADHDGLS
jgi:hypothetical protein